MAGNARKDAEKELGKTVISHENYLALGLPSDSNDSKSEPS